MSTAAPLTASVDNLPAAWLPRAHPTRIVTHWTAGSYHVTHDDLEHYHFVVDGDLRVHRGVRSVADNDSTRDDVYAQHAQHANTRSIGVAVACMYEAQEHPFNAGPYPMTLAQWQALARLCAALARVYDLRVTPKTVLAHGEVGQNLGIPQRGKWDPLVLPWAPTLSRASVAAQFRNLVQAALATRAA